MAYKRTKRRRGRRGRKDKNERRRGRRRGGLIIKILISGNFTIDILNGKEQLGGPPLYSGYAIYKLGGEPYIYSIIGKDFNFEIPTFLKIFAIVEDENTTRFEHQLKGQQRNLILLSRPKGKIKLNLVDNRFSGIIINPVCEEIDLSYIPQIPIALDIQGFIRDCSEGEKIKYKKAVLPSSNSYLVFHSNIEEFESSGLTIEQLYNLGFKELLISYNEEGFELYTREGSRFLKTTNVGTYKTGTGDILLASYFFYRINGLDPSTSSLKSKKVVEDFSNSDYQELLQLM